METAPCLNAWRDSALRETFPSFKLYCKQIIVLKMSSFSSISKRSPQKSKELSFQGMIISI